MMKKLKKEDYINKDPQHNVHLGDVSSQRKLLIAYEKYRHSSRYNLADGYVDCIERFLESNK